jgi:hypothetical protein
MFKTGFIHILKDVVFAFYILNIKRVKMALKTFNLDGKVYEEFSRHCKKEGISMSKKIENFIKGEVMKIKTGKNSKVKRIVSGKREHSFRKYC